nr:HEPN domain-containing protein [Nostoc sp. ChiQUE02]MDZ8231255.1 HEPN domain-containing protein [Nostoc sp. ChiQUE02]
MYTTNKGKLNYQLVLETLKAILPIIREKSSAPKGSIHYQTSDGSFHEVQTIGLALDLLLPEEHKDQLKEISKQIAKDFIKLNQLDDLVSIDIIYNKFLQILNNEDVFLDDKINLSSVSIIIQKLNKQLQEELLVTKTIVLPLVGVTLKEDEKCIFGSLEFLNTSDFIEELKIFFQNIPSNSNEEITDNFYQHIVEKFDNCKLLVKIKLKNQDSNTSQNTANEVIKRVCTIIRLYLPMCGERYAFFGTLGEDFLESRYSLLLSNYEQEQEECQKNLSIKNWRNHLIFHEANLLDIIYLGRANPGFYQCENIISKVVNNIKLTDFEERIWTAIYWLGQAMNEREVNLIIVKYATCLESLFNSREGGISEQISEFTAHVVGQTSDERMSCYEKVKKLYKLRSSCVHGSSTIKGMDDIKQFLVSIQSICRLAVFKMAELTGYEYYQNNDGYKKFVAYILKHHRFI